jgi:hypothetical protein
MPSGFERNIGDTLACVPAMFSEAAARERLSHHRTVAPVTSRERRLPRAEQPFECLRMHVGEWQELADLCLTAIGGTRP